MVVKINLKRVCYGRKDTKPELREYQIDGKGVVGTIAEWVEWSKENGNPELHFKDNDCSFIVGDKDLSREEKIEKIVNAYCSGGKARYGENVELIIRTYIELEYDSLLKVRYDELNYEDK